MLLPSTEGRWLHSREEIDSYSRFWFTTFGAHKSHYSFWPANSMLARSMVTGTVLYSIVLCYRYLSRIERILTKNMNLGKVTVRNLESNFAFLHSLLSFVLVVYFHFL